MQSLRFYCDINLSRPNRFDKSQTIHYSLQFTQAPLDRPHDPPSIQRGRLHGMFRQLGTLLNCGEVLARLVTSPERNEHAMTQAFDVILPRLVLRACLVDILGGRQRKYANAGFAELCTLSSFDWPTTDEIERVSRALDGLVVMLQNAELAPRVAVTVSVTLLSLEDSQSNRSFLMVFECHLAECALNTSPAVDTVCSHLTTVLSDQLYQGIASYIFTILAVRLTLMAISVTVPAAVSVSVPESDRHITTKHVATD